MTLIHIVLAAIGLVLVMLPLIERLDASQAAMHIGLAGFGLFISAGLMLLLSRNLSRPIRHLTRVAGRIADGDLDVKIPLLCKCEIGGLAASMRLMVKRLRASNAENTKLANYDTVTGLPNRHWLHALMSRRVGTNETGEEPAKGAVFFIDILDMRKIGNRFGHKTVDGLLARITRLLIEASPCGTADENTLNATTADPSKPLMGRFGGTELILSVPDMIDPDEIGALAEKMHQAVSGVIEDSGRQFRVKIAIGVARYPQDSASATEVKQYAALACNNAMDLPTANKTVLYRNDMLETIKTRETIERYLRTAIAEQQFEVYYQPKVSATDWRVTGVEALVRLNHPERGLIGPGEFIPVAEMSDLIGDIGLIVLEQAISQCAAWMRAGRSTEVSVNVSVEQFQNAEFSNNVVALLEKHECPAHLITIEITETLATTNVAGVTRQISALSEAGLRIAIDDFGTGYSNLVQLTGMKFDILKVDRSFVAGIDCVGKSREVSRAIIQLGKNLGCRVVVEGTETSAQVAAAAQLGCDEIQGFYFSRPMKRCDFDAWRDLRSQNPIHAGLEALTTRGMLRATA